MKTVNLRKIIFSQLSTIIKTYYGKSPKSEAMPYCVFTLKDVNFVLSPRDDIVLEINVYTQDEDYNACQNYADDIEALFSNLTLTQDGCFPSFYRYIRNEIPNDDDLKQIQLKIEIQNYYEGEE